MPNLSIVESTAPEPDALSALHADKASLQSQIADLQSERARLAALAAEAGEEEGALREVNRRENKLFKDWAASGAASPAPELLTHERRAAAERLALAQAKAAGAESAIAEIDARLARANEEARELGAKIDAAILAALESDFRSAKEKFSRALAGARNLAAAVFGTRAVILGQAENLRNRGQTEEANVIYRRVEALDRAGIDLDATPLVGEVNGAREAATARAASLRMGGKRRRRPHRACWSDRWGLQGHAR